MASIKVAFGDKDNPKKVEVEGKKGKKKEKKVPRRLASGSATTLKKLMGQYPNTKWSVAHYTVKPNVETLCTIIVDVKTLEPDEDSTYDCHVTDTGRVMKD